jgi:hypothetical protein
MCYSIESSARTTLFSLAAIIYLLSSGDPYYKWLAIVLIGWCLMQFAELILWSTNPRKGCTDLNKLITMTLIPLVLVMQPLGSLFGSLYVIPWSKSTDFRKNFIIYYSLFIVSLVSWAHYYKPYKVCTTVTKDGHLFWNTSNIELANNLLNKSLYFIWGLIIIIPMFMFWDKNITILVCLILIPSFGFSYGFLNTDSRGSIWCYYTSYTSIIASGFLFLKQAGLFNIITLK